LGPGWGGQGNTRIPLFVGHPGARKGFKNGKNNLN
jgi:hypothetical protein